MKKKFLKKILIILICIVFAVFIYITAVNIYIQNSTKQKILTEFEDNNYDCILVLGAGVRDDAPSPMLEDRLNTAIELYKNGIAPKLLMSGDHGRKDYDEVNIMKNYAISQGVPSEDIFMDHAGFSTYESVYRARDIFQVEKMVIVTQKYHLYRALFIAQSLGIQADGANSDSRKYSGQTNREIREIVARNKDFLYCIFKPEPKYLGEAISVMGNGDITND